MALYSYRCTACGTQDQRVAGIDDDTAVCTVCAALMFRQDDPFEPQAIVCAWCGAVKQEGREPVSHGICEACAEKEVSHGL